MIVYKRTVIGSREIYECEVERDVDKAYATFLKTGSEASKKRYLKLAKEYNDLYKDELYKLSVRFRGR